MLILSRPAVRAHGTRLSSIRPRPERLFMQHACCAIRFSSSGRKSFKFPAPSKFIATFLYVVGAGLGYTAGRVRERAWATSAAIDAPEKTEDPTDTGDPSRQVPSSGGDGNEDRSSIPSSYSEEAQTPSKDDDDPEVFMQFGPHASYFIRCKDSWRYHGPTTTAKSWDELDISTPYVVALASNGGWFAAYKSIVGSVATWKLSLNDVQKQNIQVWQHDDDQWIRENVSHDAYQMLAEWLPQNFGNDIAGFRKSSMTFGPGDSFYVRSPRGCLWNNLPASLEQIIVKQMEKSGLGPPKMVSLGAGGTWVTTWDNKYYLWVLGNRNYDDVHEALKLTNKDQSGGIKYIALSPYEDAYFIHYKNGIINYNSPSDSQADKGIMHFIFRYLQERARADKVTYRLLAGRNKTSVVISPTTSYEKYDNVVAVLSEDPSSQSWVDWLWKKVF